MYIFKKILKEDSKWTNSNNRVFHPETGLCPSWIYSQSLASPIEDLKYTPQTLPWPRLTPVSQNLHNNCTIRKKHKRGGCFHTSLSSQWNSRPVRTSAALLHHTPGTQSRIRFKSDLSPAESLQALPTCIILLWRSRKWSFERHAAQRAKVCLPATAQLPAVSDGCCRCRMAPFHLHPHLYWQQQKAPGCRIR